MDKKRLLIAIIFGLVCIGIGYFLYWVFFASPKTVEVILPGEVLTPGELPTAEKGKITPAKITPSQLPTAPGVTREAEELIATKPLKNKQIIDTPILGANFDKSGLGKFYNQTDGKFYHLLPDGTVKTLSDQIFYNVQNITWSSTKNESIIEYPDGSNIYYNFDTKKQVTLPKHWEEFSFSALGDKVASKSLGLAPENRWLITTDPEGKNISLIEPMGGNADKVIVDWSPSRQVVALARTGEPLGDDRQEVLFVGLHGENFKSIIVEGRALETKWSPTGDKLLYNVHSARSNFKPELWVVNAEGDNIGTGRKLLDLNTWVDKCVFEDNRFVYCGVPTKLDIGSGFAPTMADYTPDRLYKIDTKSGLKTELNIDPGHVIENIFIDSANQILYFTDKNQAGLFNLPL